MLQDCQSDENVLDGKFDPVIKLELLKEKLRSFYR